MTTCAGSGKPADAEATAKAEAAEALWHGRQACSVCGRPYFTTKAGTIPKHGVAGNPEKS